LLPRTFINDLVVQYFGFERTWWRLLQKRFVCANIDINVFIPSNKLSFETGMW